MAKFHRAEVHRPFFIVSRVLVEEAASGFVEKDNEYGLAILALLAGAAVCKPRFNVFSNRKLG